MRGNKSHYIQIPFVTFLVDDAKIQL